MKRKAFRKSVVAILLAGIMALATACGGSGDTAGSTSADSTSEDGTSAESASEDSTSAGEEHQYDEAAKTGQGIKNAFLSENITDQVVKNDDDALEVILSVMDQLGGDRRISRTA